ncbi:hypothetical protein ABTX85_38680 [Streptomyces sp. NPDC096097]|uniref:hypothetical protein n=1 Tax=Streptomyces sp. NPDC096097 TaxID=3155546 RepID=UPI00332B6167
MNDRLPPELLARLAADPEGRVRSWVIQWGRDVPDAVRRMLLTDTDPDSEVREAVAAHPGLTTGLRDLLAEDPDMFVRNATAARTDTPADLRERLVAGLEPDSPVAEWLLSFGRSTRTCPPRAAVLPSLTRQQAEALPARAGL